MNSYIPVNQTRNVPISYDNASEYQLRIDGVVKYLICHENEPLTKLAKTLLEQGYSLSEVSDATNKYLGIQNGTL
jgi:hypothetical protein